MVKITCPIYPQTIPRDALLTTNYSFDDPWSQGRSTAFTVSAAILAALAF